MRSVSPQLPLAAALSLLLCLPHTAHAQVAPAGSLVLNSFKADVLAAVRDMHMEMYDAIASPAADLYDEMGAGKFFTRVREEEEDVVDDLLGKARAGLSDLLPGEDDEQPPLPQSEAATAVTSLFDGLGKFLGSCGSTGARTSADSGQGGEQDDDAQPTLSLAVSALRKQHPATTEAQARFGIPLSKPVRTLASFGVKYSSSEDRRKVLLDRRISVGLAVTKKGHLSHSGFHVVISTSGGMLLDEDVVGQGMWKAMNRIPGFQERMEEFLDGLRGGGSGPSTGTKFERFKNRFKDSKVSLKFKIPPIRCVVDAIMSDESLKLSDFFDFSGVELTMILGNEGPRLGMAAADRDEQVEANAEPPAGHRNVSVALTAVLGSSSGGDGVEEALGRCSRSDAASQAGELAEFLRRLREVGETGLLRTSFCIGSRCDDPARSITGLALAELTNQCTEASLQVTSDLVTLGGIAQVAGGDQWSDLMGTLGIGGIGLRDVSAQLNAGDGNVMFRASGAPVFAGSALSFISDLGLLFHASVELQPGFAEMLFEVSTPADNSHKKFRVRDARGEKGFALFMGFSAVVRGPPVALLKARLPVSVCVERCDGDDRRDLHFTGVLGFVFNPSPIVSGDLIADAWWYRAFGVPFLHIGNMLLGLDVSLATLLPTRFAIGGTACLGTQENCEADMQPFIKAHAYVGLSATRPDKNFFVGMVSRLTLGDVIDVFSEYIPKLNGVKGLLGGKTLATGLYPFDESQCSRPANGSTTTADIDLDCYAYLTVSFLDSRLEFSSGVLDIPSGVQLSGRLNLFGWNIYVHFKVDEKGILVDARMDPVKLKIKGVELLNIGRHLDRNNKAVEGADFHLEMRAVPLRAAIDINGAFDMPLLGAYGEVAILLNKDQFSFDSAITLFHGAWRSRAVARIPTDFSSFFLSLTDVNMVLVNFKEITFEVAGRVGKFKLKVTLLFFVDFGLEVAVGRTPDGRFDLSFSLGAQLGRAASIDVSARALVAKPITNTEFDLAVDIKVDWDRIGGIFKDAVKAVAAAAQRMWNGIKAAGKKIMEGVKKALTWVTGGLRKALDSAKAFFRKLADNPFFKKMAQAGRKLAKGDVKGFFKDVGEGLADALSRETIKNRRVVRYPNEKNSYGCVMQRDRWERKRCGAVFGAICRTVTQQSSKYADPKCMRRVAREAAWAEEEAERAKVTEDQYDEERAKFPGLAAVADGQPLPDLQRFPIPQQHVKSGAGASVLVSATAGVRKLAGKGSSTAFEADATHLAVQQIVDLSTRDAAEAGVRRLEEAVGEETAGKAVPQQPQQVRPKETPRPRFTSPGGLLRPRLPRPRPRTSGWLRGRSARRVRTLSLTPAPAQQRCDRIDYMLVRPAPVSNDAACMSKAEVTLSEEVPTPAPAAAPCGALGMQLSWQATCPGVVTAPVTQLLTLVPPPLSFSSVPPDVSLAKGGDSSPEVLGVPEWDEPCALSTVLEADDSPASPAGCGRSLVKRTWVVTYDEEDRPGCKHAHRAVHEQKIYFVDPVARC